jgi:hypothetical protein
MRKIPFTFCAGEFYIVGKIDVDTLNCRDELVKNKKRYHIEIEIEEEDIIRFDNIKPDIPKDDNAIIKVNFATGEREYIV